MNANVGSIAKIVRLVLALALFSLFFILPGDQKWLGLIGLVPLFTGLVSWYFLYTVFGTIPAAGNSIGLAPILSGQGRLRRLRNAAAPPDSEVLLQKIGVAICPHCSTASPFQVDDMHAGVRTLFAVQQGV